MLAPRPSRSLVSPSANANMPRIFSGWRRLCWRLAPREALFLRPPTPTGARFSRADGAFVGALLPAKPYFSVRQRQHGPVFPRLTAPLLAPCSPRNLVSSSGHANTSRFFPVCQCRCWRLAPLKAFALHPATPTGRPESIPRRPAPMLAPCSRAFFAPPASGTKACTRAAISSLR